MDSVLSFAVDLADALPECVALYLAGSDRLIPNAKWRREVGETSRLGEMASLSVDVEELARRLTSESETPTDFDCALAADGLGTRTLHVSRLPGQPGVFCFYLKDDGALRRVEQMRKDFIANVSHELRTPLTAVRGYVETLLEPKFLTMERVREFLPIIFEHTERLHNLMLDLLSLSRLESPNTHIELSPQPLGEELLAAIEATAPLARMKNITVEFESPPESVRVLANAEHMERILVNLLDNAIKYSQPGGRVRVWTEDTGDGFLWTHVQDEGAGIHPEERHRVFERFYRTKGALSGRERGSGLGLAIVKHIVQQLGGEIGVSSTLGRGSDFYFSLRLAKRGEAPGGQKGRDTEPLESLPDQFSRSLD